MGKSRISKRREMEAVEELEKAAPRKKKKATRKKATTATRTRKKKADTPARRRLIWVVYSSTMREEGRFLYHERDKAEEKLNALLAKGKRRYFIQPIKEPLDADGNPLVPDDQEMKKAPPAPVVEEEETEAEADVETEAETDDEPAAETDDTADD
ncbi:MAG: hypothetical protein RIK87_07220 [Fuerstiella sp.]